MSSPPGTPKYPMSDSTQWNARNGDPLQGCVVRFIQVQSTDVAVHPQDPDRIGQISSADELRFHGHRHATTWEQSCDPYYSCDE